MTRHAYERWLQRVGGTASYQTVHRKVAQDVRSAIAAGRMSKSRPRFMTGIGRRRKNRSPLPVRFCWTEGEGRGYCVLRKPDCWLVLTVWTNTELAA